MAHGKIVENAYGHKVGALEDLAAAQRLRLAFGAAEECAFDWTLADDVITWDGATDFLPQHVPDREALPPATGGGMLAAGAVAQKEA